MHVFAMNKKSINVGGNLYDIYYPSDSYLTTIDLINNDIQALYNIFTNADILIRSKIINGNSLETYVLASKTEYFKVNNVTIHDIFNKYGIKIGPFLDQWIYTPADCKTYLKTMVTGIFRNLNIQENSSTISYLTDYLGNKFYLYKVRKESISSTTNIGLDSINQWVLSNLLKLGFQNQVTTLSNSISTALNNLSNEIVYTSNITDGITTLTDLNYQYNFSTQKLQTDSLLIQNLINQQYSTAITTNLESLISSDSTAVSPFNLAKENANTGYTYILNSYTRWLLQANLNEKKLFIQNKILEKKNLINSFLGGNSSTGATSNSWDTLTMSGSTYVIWSNTNLNVFTGSTSINITAFSNTGSSNWSTGSTSDMYDTTVNAKELTNYDRIWMSISNNIDSNTQNSGAINSVMANVSWIRQFNTFLQNDIKSSFLSLKNSNDTIKDIPLNTLSLSGTTDSIANSYMINLGKRMINNLSVGQNTVLPFGMKINNDTVFKNELLNKPISYLAGYDKSLYTSVASVTNEEWFDSVSFNYTPSPKLIKDSTKNIGIDYGNLIIYYLDNTYSSFNLNLDNGYNYKLTINSYNNDTANIKLLYNYEAVSSNVLLVWNRSISNSYWIISTIDTTKYATNQNNVLFVNDILKK